MASRRMEVESADAFFSASIFSACRSVSNDRGFMHRAAAVIGEIKWPVAGSSNSEKSAMTFNGTTGRLLLAARHLARRRSRCARLP